MIRSTNDIRGFKVAAKDGECGKVDDFLFDDAVWTVRYLVVDIGDWLTGRKVLIPPSELDVPNWEEQAFPVNLTKEEIENSPPISSDEPVSRQHEVALHQHFGWQPYWGGGVATGGATVPVTRPTDPATAQEGEREKEVKGDPGLRSAKELVAYYIQAEDDEIGHVDDVLLDDDNWVVRYLVVDTRNWLPGKKVLVAVDWIREVSWLDTKVFVDLTKERIRNGPEYNSSGNVDRMYEETLFDHYQRPRYWL